MYVPILKIDRCIDIKYIMYKIYIFRNGLFEQQGIKAPTAYKTGTTICGVIYKVDFLDKY